MESSNALPVIVCCIAKNEDNYIREFVEYHLGIGFDKIVVGDNNKEEKRDSVPSILADYIEDGRVEIVDLIGLDGMQLTFYNDIAANYDYEWCAFIDCDEFITFGKKGVFQHQGLSPFESRGFCVQVELAGLRRQRVCRV